MQITRIIAVPALLASGVALAACGAGARNTATSSGGGGNPDAQTAAIVQCYRTHGDPTFPDPVYDPSDGRWHFDRGSPASAPLSTQRACAYLFPSVSPSPPVPQAEFRELVLLAQCIRQHGVPTWPDPNPAGQFLLPQSLLRKTTTSERATRACQRYIPSGGMDVVAAPGSAATR
jgi:hypothetical protein